MTVNTEGGGGWALRRTNTVSQSKSSSGAEGRREPESPRCVVKPASRKRTSLLLRETVPKCQIISAPLLQRDTCAWVAKRAGIRRRDVCHKLRLMSLWTCPPRRRRPIPSSSSSVESDDTDAKPLERLVDIFDIRFEALQSGSCWTRFEFGVKWQTQLTLKKKKEDMQNVILST